ncbi:MAG: PASTA domain-containing protein, partial [Bacteroidales bacterium]|nr:PASTA domain-containing protein [Bacteroidales bacterium]
GSVFAYTVRNVADALYAMDCENGQNIQDKGALRDTWKKDSPSVSASESNIVPDLKNCGLADAIWKIENSGYQCEYQGVGSVVRQSPAAGSKYTRGGTIRIVLK